jgi:hypothetical protein
MDLPGENGGVTVVPSVYHNGIIESVHEPFDRTENEVNFSKLAYTGNRQGEERCRNESTAAS